MKKIFKYIGLIGITNFALLTNVNAATVSVEPKPGHPTNFGYNTQTQTIKGKGACAAVAYCLDKGKANQSSFKGCSFIDVSKTAFAKVAADTSEHDAREYLYRVIANNSGLTKTNYSLYPSVLNPGEYGYKKYEGVAIDPVNTQNDGDVKYSTSSSGGVGTVTATITLGKSGYASSFYISSGSGSLNVNDNGDGSYNVTITNIPIAECEGGNVTLSVKGMTSSNTTSSDLYFVDCHNSKQNYIIEMNGCSISDITNDTSDNLEFQFNVPDEECKCSGESSLCQECQQEGESSDNKEYAKSCANSGKFEAYCGVSLKKITDTDAFNHTLIASHSTNVKTTLGETPYCNVYCLEDIKYTMPGKIKTKNGRYFKLKTGFDLGVSEDGQNISITATRKCITSEIKTQNYIKDVIDAQIAVINAYNIYKHDKQYNIALASADGNKDPGTGCNNNTTPCTAGCSYNTHKPKDETKKYKIAEITSIDYSTGEVYVHEVDTQLESIEWVTDSTCNSPADSSKPEAKILNPGEIASKLEEMYQIINNYKSCFEWTNNYCFDPKAYFEYKEVYNKVNGEIPIKSTQYGDEKESYYTNVDNEYNGSSTGYKKITANYIYAETDKINNSNSSEIDITSKYVKKEVTSTRVFEDGIVDIYSYHPYGTIKYEPCENGKCTYLGKVLPVALQHDPETNIYSYDIYFKNVGVAGNDTNCSEQPNRINGKKCSLTATEAGCENDYSCYYETASCPDCEVECVCPENSKNCYVEDKVCKYKLCDDCEVICIGCVVDRGNTTISYKTISLNDVYQDDTQIASNWTTEEIEEIEKEGQKIYDEEPQYSFILTPQTMSKIREYNEISASNKANSQNIPSGGYNNDTLTCTIKGTNTINCKSSFLRGYLNKNAIRISLPESWDE